jgi:hypothetical protein
MGESLVPFLKGEKTAGRDVFIESDYRDYTHQRAIRTADGWKYVITLESGKEELFNLNADPGEKKNLLASESEKAKELKDELFAHIRDTLKKDPEAPMTRGCLPVYQGECE